MSGFEDFDARESDIPEPLDVPETVPELQQEIVHERYERMQAKKAEQVGKTTSLFFSLICSVFLGYQCWSYDKRGEPVPVLTWFPLLCFIGTGLGVSIDASAVGKFFMKD